MGMLEQLGAALGLASLAGINLYLTAFAPVIAFFFFVILLAIAAVIIRKTFGTIRAVWKGFRQRRRGVAQ
jgi:hypothetical protein